MYTPFRAVTSDQLTTLRPSSTTHRLLVDKIDITLLNTREYPAIVSTPPSTCNMGCGPSRPRRFNGNGVSYIDHPQDLHSSGGMGHGRSHGGMSSTGMGGSAISGRHGMSSGMSGGRHGMSSGISSGMSMGRSSRTSGGMSSGTSMGRSSRSGGGLGGMMSGFGRNRRC